MTTIRYDFDPSDVVTERIGRYVHGQWRSLSEMIAIALMLGALFVISKLVLAFYDNYFRSLDPELPTVVAIMLWVGITFGLVGAYLVMIFVSRYRDLRRDQDNTQNGYRSGPITVELSAKGISTRSPGRAEQVPWHSVKKVKKTPLGLGIALDETQFIPLDAQSLPEEMTKEDALSLIETWRAGSA